MNEAFLLLGSNMGNRQAMLQAAREAIYEKAGTQVLESALYETSAWGNEDQQDFINQVIVIQTPLLPHMLLHCLLAIEEKLGRHRVIKNEPRTIDIDILFYNDTLVNDKDLHIPHPLLHLRRFVLVPLIEIAPLKVHPLLRHTVASLLTDCPDKGEVKKM
ncbi:MAG: 2-amino-4-hydroxy-6-hydroxymethyldihydropteridine diphosphokinase [Ferruginibacter sp.]